MQQSLGDGWSKCLAICAVTLADVVVPASPRATCQPLVLTAQLHHLAAFFCRHMRYSPLSAYSVVKAKFVVVKPSGPFAFCSSYVILAAGEGRSGTPAIIRWEGIISKVLKWWFWYVLQYVSYSEGEVVQDECVSRLARNTSLEREFPKFHNGSYRNS
jgi:hypothetical protein